MSAAVISGMSAMAISTASASGRIAASPDAIEAPKIQKFDVGAVHLLNFRREIGDGNFEDQKAVGIGIAVLFVNENGIVHEEENGAIGREVGPGGIVLDRAFEGFEFAFESIESLLEFRRGIVCGTEG